MSLQRPFLYPKSVSEALLASAVVGLQGLQNNGRHANSRTRDTPSKSTESLRWTDTRHFLLHPLVVLFKTVFLGWKLIVVWRNRGPTCDSQGYRFPVLGTVPLRRGCGNGCQQTSIIGRPWLWMSQQQTVTTRLLFWLGWIESMAASTEQCCSIRVVQRLLTIWIGLTSLGSKYCLSQPLKVLNDLDLALKL